MFEGFETIDADIDGITIHAVIGGKGDPLLLLHGYPQTHALWHKIAPRLAERYTTSPRTCADMVTAANRSAHWITATIVNA